MRAIKKTITADNRGVLIRLLYDDMDVPKDGYRAMDELIDALGLPAHEVHLLMDFRDISADNLPDVTATATRFLVNLPAPHSWKTIVLACSAFPENLAASQRAQSRRYLAANGT